MSQETVSTEEVRILRQQMAEMYEAWMSGQAPPSSICDYLNTNMSHPVQVLISDSIYPSEFGLYANTFNVAKTSTVRPLSIPREDVANVVSGTQKGPRGPVYQYAPPQFHHYLPMQDTQYSIVPPQYAVYRAQPYAHPPNYP
ncbi:hypothetical protein RDI58_013328 [Solanum bulbocastanum]|uniref:Uncharacterized protein n=1 Tax=Solanum bulbocastanum TaxID=147425 RepID=A0AAN8TJC2_SOLBU